MYKFKKGDYDCGGRKYILAYRYFGFWKTFRVFVGRASDCMFCKHGIEGERGPKCSAWCGY